MLGEVATATLGGIPPVRLCAVPGKEVLVLVKRSSHRSPIVPVLLVCVNHVGLVVTSKVEAHEVLFRQTARYIELCPHASLLVPFFRTDKTHHVERVNKRFE